MHCQLICGKRKRPARLEGKNNGLYTRGNYKLLLRKGAFSKVLLCQSKNSDQKYAMKIMNIIANHNRFDLEDRLMCTIKHPFLMSAYDSFKVDDYHCIVMKCLNVDMAEYLNKKKRLSEDHTRFYGAEIVSAVGYLHTLGVVHKDIKLENLIMDDEGHIILGDYGLSVENMNSDSLRSEFEGTPSYMAPEMFSGSYGLAVDWWATGIVLYKMMTGMFPPWQMNRPESQDISALVAFQAEQLLMSLLVKSPTERLGSSPAGHLNIQNHPFFEPIEWHKLNAKLSPAPYKPSLSLTLTKRTNGAGLLYRIFTRLR